MKPLPTPVRADSLSRQVFGILREAVFEGKFQQGELLAEIKVAKWLTVSQATVREALVLLEQNGLVIRQKNRKTQVNKLSAAEIRDRISMRVALEPMAVVKAAETMNAGDLAELSRIACLPLSESQTEANATLADLDFHRYIWEKAGSPVLAKTLEQVTTPLFAFVRADRTETTAVHLQLIDAMRAGNRTLIQQSVQHHIEDSYRSFLAQANSHATASA